MRGVATPFLEKATSGCGDSRANRCREARFERGGRRRGKKRLEPGGTGGWVRGCLARKKQRTGAAEPKKVP